MSILGDSESFTLREMADILGLKYPEKAPQAIDPAIIKWAKILRRSPRKAFKLAAAALDHVEQEEFEAETLPRLQALKEGRSDRSTATGWREV